jgi:hypothetical protein
MVFGGIGRIKFSGGCLRQGIIFSLKIAKCGDAGEWGG